MRHLPGSRAADTRAVAAADSTIKHPEAAHVIAPVPAALVAHAAAVADATQRWCTRGLELGFQAVEPA